MKRQENLEFSQSKKELGGGGAISIEMIIN